MSPMSTSEMANCGQFEFSTFASFKGHGFLVCFGFISLKGIQDLPFYYRCDTYHLFQLFSFQKQAGCDHILNSKARKDKCGICGGDNSSCKTVAGTFNTVHYGKSRLLRTRRKKRFKNKLLTSCIQEIIIQESINVGGKTSLAII